jgi:hypothetical protein
MDCQECKEQLLDLIYEEGIRPRRRLELLTHVDLCPGCHDEYTALLQSRAVLQEWPDENLSWSLRVDPPSAPIQPRRLQGAVAWRPAWASVNGAVLAVLLLVAVLAVTQSRVTWRSGALTLQAHLWKSADAPGSYEVSPQDLLAEVDRMIAESEQRQNKLFGTALIKTWEDLEIRNQYERGEIQTAFQGLQKQNEARWEQTPKAAQ